MRHRYQMRVVTNVLMIIIVKIKGSDHDLNS